MAQATYAQLPGSGYEPPLYRDGRPHYENSERSFGRFTVVRNIEDYRAAPILHGPWLTKEALLKWQDSSGRIGFSFVDNGASVRFRPEGRSADGKTTCIMQGVLVGYDPEPSNEGNWQKMQPFLVRQLRSCTAIAPADLNRAASEMKRSGADYVSAANAWKAVSKELFGPSGRRCVAERMVRRWTSIPPFTECTRYSSR